MYWQTIAVRCVRTARDHTLAMENMIVLPKWLRLSIAQVVRCFSDQKSFLHFKRGEMIIGNENDQVS